MNNIAKYRGIKNISQKDFANQLGMTRPGLSFIENGNCKFINEKKLKLISEILEVSYVKLLGLDNLKFLPTNEEDIDFMIDALNEYRKEVA